MKPISLSSEIFSRGVNEIVTRNELDALLKRGKLMRIKLGIDATSPDLHIGHAVPLWKIRALQDAGHKAVIVLGDFTTQIGDPTGKSKTRPVLSLAEIKKNIQSIRKQIGKVLRTEPQFLEFRKNSEWGNKMKARDFLQLLSSVTHAQLINRDMFQKRIQENAEIFMHELLYPILQGNDSVAIKSDITIIGSDQLFNEHMGRFFQEKAGQRPQIIMTMKILPGLDGGEKMSKSIGNYIGLADTPRDKFGKAMRLIDALIVPYLEGYTDIEEARIREIEQNLKQGGNPRDAKLIFAEALVRRYHGAIVARAERERFTKIFSERAIPDNPDTLRVPYGAAVLTDLVVASGATASKSEAHRLIVQGAIEVDGTVQRDPRAIISIRSGLRLRVGKHRFFKIK